MAINVKDLPEWAQKQVAEQIAAQNRAKAARTARGAMQEPRGYLNAPLVETAAGGDLSALKAETSFAVQITINLPPVTKKNSQRIVKRGKRYIPIPSKAFEKYEKDAGTWLEKVSGVRIDEPVEVQCRFYMPTHRRVDLTNLLEAIDDVLVHYEVLEDDNSKIIVSHDGSRVLYDKENPRTEILITSMTEKKR